MGNVFFEEEGFVSLPNIAIDNDQAIIPVVFQDSILVQINNDQAPILDIVLEQDNNEIPPTALIE